MKRIANVGFGFVLSLGLLGVQAAAQNQTQSKPPDQSAPGSSLGDYARQVRKDSGQPKAKPKVFDNDNLPREDKLSIVGTQPPAPPEKAAGEAPAEAKPAQATAATAATAPAGAAAAAPSEEEEARRQALNKQWQERLAAQRDQIDLLQRELDVLQREYQIRAAAFYADAGNRIRNSAAWDKQDGDYKQQIAAKQKALDEAKQKLEDLQEEARRAGVPSSVREP
jgi:hypothetical protein